VARQVTVLGCDHHCCDTRGQEATAAIPIVFPTYSDPMARGAIRALAIIARFAYYACHFCLAATSIFLKVDAQNPLEAFSIADKGWAD
jgi:hypothetical protein